MTNLPLIDASYLSRSDFAPTTLIELMPDPTTSTGIFEYLADLPYIEPESNNIEYLYNRSGDKIPSPLVTRLADGDTLTSVSLQSLARIILTRYRYKWNRIWDDYSSSNPLWNTLDITEVTADNGTSSDTTNDTSTLVKSNTTELTKGTADTTVLSGSHDDTTTASDSSVSTRSGSTTEAEGGSTLESKTQTGESVTRTQHEGTIGDVTSSAGNSSVWGFNSVNAVKAREEQTSDGSVRTYDNADTTTETPAVEDNRVIAHGRTNTTSYNGLTDGISSNTAGTTTRTFNDETSATTHTGTDRTARSGTDTENRETTKSGTTSSTRNSRTTGYNIRHLSDKTELLKLLYTDPFFSDFWEVVYRDIDSVLTCSIFA